MPVNSSYQLDFDQEAILGSYLDECYKTGFTQGDFKRVTDKSLQYKGVDLIFTPHLNGSKTIYIDEKSMLHYINQQKTTFTFELSYLKNGGLRQGWLFDDNKLTEYYFLITSIMLKEYVTPLKINNKIRLREIGEINSCLATVVHRDSLIDKLTHCKIDNPKKHKLLCQYESQTLTEDICNRLAIALREQTAGSAQRLFLTINQNITLCLSGQLNEKPVNLMINLDFLQRIAKCKQVKLM